MLEAERKSSAVRTLDIVVGPVMEAIVTAPFISPIVEDVDLNPLLVNSPDTVVGPVIDAIVTAPFIKEIVADVERNPLLVNSFDTVVFPVMFAIVTAPFIWSIVADVLLKLFEMSCVKKVTIPLIEEKVEEVERSPLFVNSLAIVTFPSDVVIVEVPESPPPAVTQNGKLFVVIGEDVETEPPPPPPVSLSVPQ